MSNDLRTDDSHIISYPQSADARGTARIYHLRKPYYLGSHDSPLSYVMFGIWKHHLQQTGEPPATAVVREQAESLLKARIASSRLWNKRAAMAITLTLASLFSGWCGTKIGSTAAPSRVDGIVLTTSETDLVRRFRVTNERHAEMLSKRFHTVPQQVAAFQRGEITLEEIRKRIQGF